MRCSSAFLFCLFSFLIGGCMSTEEEYSYSNNTNYTANQPAYNPEVYASRMPQHVNVNGEKTIIVDPAVHAWGAYNKQGDLLRGGIATAGSEQCEDSDRSCHTGTGVFHIHSMGDESCYSRIYPKPHGGGLMPYCMYFNGGQALHGSPDGAVVEDNISHGCVRMRIPDAEWLRYNFANDGTKVIVKAY